MSPDQRNPEELRDEIDETREQLGGTVEALAGKADVKGQAKAKVDSARLSAQQKAEEIARKAKQAAPDSAGAGAQQVAGAAQENPLPIAIAGAFVAGVLVGWILSR